MNRGSFAPLTSSGRRLSGFNEAPIHESGKSEMAGLGRRWDGVASMRPRFMNRGSGRQWVEGCSTRSPASMRPRFMNRGSD